ncbi:MAG: YheV family putative metal-binding protein [Pseudomonadales bacterium]|nr:YheV family putative metal-binding protein [Pseudomonadales bacterium]
MSIIKRFVAGAVCPRCGQMDTIRVYRNEIREYRECVRCDYRDGQNLDGTPESVSELQTRVNQPSATNASGEKIAPVTAQPIKFDPNPKRNSAISGASKAATEQSVKAATGPNNSSEQEDS